MIRGRPLLLLLIGLALLGPVRLAGASEDATERELEKYRQMLKADPWSNPAMLDADRGEALWRERRGGHKGGRRGGGVGAGPGNVGGAVGGRPRVCGVAGRGGVIG